MRHWRLLQEVDKQDRLRQRRQYDGAGHMAAMRAAIDHARSGRYKEAYQTLASNIAKLDSNGHELMSRSAANYVNSVFDRHHGGEDIPTEEMHVAAHAVAHIHPHHSPPRSAQTDDTGYTLQSSRSLSHSQRSLKNKEGDTLTVNRVYLNHPPSDGHDAPDSTIGRVEDASGDNTGPTWYHLHHKGNIYRIHSGDRDALLSELAPHSSYDPAKVGG